MGLINSSLQIGRSSIMAHNLALDVTGNNIANAGTEGYARQVVEMESVRGAKTVQGPIVGLGVSAASIQRVTDVYLEQRLRDARSALQSAAVQSDTLSRMESAFNELSDSDLSSIMNKFFEALSTLQTTPEEMSVRRGVVETGITLSENIRMLRDRVDGLRSDIEAEVSGVVNEINSLTSEIAQLNMEVARVAATAADNGGATALLDRGDTLLGKLSDLIDMRVVAMENGTVNIFV